MSRQLTRVCTSCKRRKYLREFGRKYGQKDHRLDTRCKSCRAKYDHQRHGSRAAAVCLDCGKPSHFRRCETCRGKHQASAEAVLGIQSRSPTLCGLPTRTGACGNALSFGTDFLGRTTSWCGVHGEYLVPVIGVRHYDQGATLEEELEAFVERGKRLPEPAENASQHGMAFRQRSNEYLSRGAA